MNIQLNGQPFELVDGGTILTLLQALELTDKRLAVEVNEDLVTRSLFETHQLHEGDHVEVVQAIGGG